MRESFFFSSHVLLLFKEWQISRTSVFVDALLGMFLFTLIYQIASYYHSRKVKQNIAKSVSLAARESSSYGTFGVRSAQQTPWTRTAFLGFVCKRIIFTWRYILGSLSYAILVAANYFIMLAVMSYNAWFLIIVCVATGIAYYFLQVPARQRRSILNCEDTEQSPLNVENSARHEDL